MFFRRSLTLAIAAVGTGIFWLLGLPLPFLFGPLFACLIAALLGVNLKGAGQLGIGMRTILGVAVGASITPQVVERLPQMTASILMVPIYVILIGMVGVPFFRKVYKFDWPTAWYAAMPGGLQDMVIFGEVGLSGEIRPVPSGQERLSEAAKHGFKRAIVPKGNAPKGEIPGMQVIGVSKLSEALGAVE